MTIRKFRVRDLVALVGVSVVVVSLGLALAQAHSVEEDWNQLYSQALRPVWESVVAPLVVGMSVLVVLARVWVLFGWFEVLAPLPRTTTSRSHQGDCGIIASVVSLSLVEVLALLQSAGTLRWIVAMFIVLSALIGAHFLARWFASARTVHVEAVMGKAPDDAGAGQIVAFLEQLGAERPRGIEVARGTNVTALSGVGLTAAPANAVAAAALQLVNMLIPRAPWRVRVDAEDAHKMSVAVTRNGRVLETATINRDVLGLRVDLPNRADGGTAQHPDLYTMAAAVVLTTLVGEYDDIEGLHGATDWRSVGLCAIATFEFSDPKARLPLLARAVDFDPQNRLALSAFHHALGRRTADRVCLTQYIDWLNDEIGLLEEEDQRKRQEQEEKEEHRKSDKGKGSPERLALEWSVYRRQLKRNRASAALNRFHLKDVDATRTAKDRREAWDCAFGLLRDLFNEEPKVVVGYDGRLSPPDSNKGNRDKGTEDARRLASSMWPSAASTYAAIYQEADPLWRNPVAREYFEKAREQVRQKEHLGMHDTYNLACLFVTRGEFYDQAEAVKRLQVSDEIPLLREWRQQDPQLSEFRLTQLYRTSFLADPATELSYLEPFSPYKELLAAAGLNRDPMKFYRLAETEPGRVAQLLGVDMLVVRRLSQIADVAGQLLEKSSKYGIEVCAELIAVGIDSWFSLRRGDLSERIDKALTNRLKESPSAHTISKLLSVAEPTGLAWALGGFHPLEHLPGFAHGDNRFAGQERRTR